MTSAERAQAELERFGISSKVRRFANFEEGGQEVLVFSFTANSGTHKGKTFQVGVSFPDGGYPEYPPHFIHVAGEEPFSQLPPHTSYTEGDVSWNAYSAPPSEIWDRLRPNEKHMGTIVRTHMQRMWDQS